MQQRRHRHLPALALVAQAVLDGHLDVAEEDLVELRLARDLPQRPHLDPGRVHVDEEVGEVPVARRVRVALRDEDAEVGDVRERRPHLLPVDDVDVAAALGARARGGEVGARVRLREALAPDLVGREDRLEVARLLLLRPVRDDRRPGHVEADHADMGRSLHRGELLVEDRLEAVRRTRAAVLLRPGQPCVAGLVQLAAPLADEGILEPLGAAAAAALVRREVRIDPGAQLRPKRPLLLRVAQVHEWRLTRRGCRKQLGGASRRRCDAVAPAAASPSRGSGRRRATASSSGAGRTRRCPRSPRPPGT